MENEALQNQIEEIWKKLSFSRILNHIKKTYKKESVKDWFYYYMIQGTLDTNDKSELLDLLEELKNIK